MQEATHAGRRAGRVQRARSSPSEWGASFALLRATARPGSGAGGRLLCNYLLRAAGVTTARAPVELEPELKAHARRTASVATFFAILAVTAVPASLQCTNLAHSR